jgi:hypothetical protein
LVRPVGKRPVHGTGILAAIGAARSTLPRRRPLELQVAGTRLLCESLAGLGVLEQDGHTFVLANRSRKWLHPSSGTYIGTWLEHTTTYREWYGDLERIVRDGGSFEIHREPADDEEYWRVYITGQYEIARLSAAEVAKAVRPSAAALGMLFHLTSGADLPSPDELAGYFAEAGFERPKRTKVRRFRIRTCIRRGLCEAQPVAATQPGIGIPRSVAKNSAKRGATSKSLLGRSACGARRLSASCAVRCSPPTTRHVAR